MEEFLIQKSTLDATADKLREALEINKYEFDPQLIAGDGIRFDEQDTVTVYYIEWIDSDNYEGTQESDNTNDKFLWYGFDNNNEDQIVPVIYKTDIYGDEPDSPDYEDPFYYVGTAEIDGVVYDKWRKIEATELPWDGTQKKFIYTNRLVLSNEIFPQEFPNKIDEVVKKSWVDNLYGTTWKWNEQLSFQKTIEVKFICDGREFNGFYNTLNSNGEMQLTYLTENEGSFLAYSSTNSWTKESYKYITFVDTVKTPNASNLNDSKLIELMYQNAEIVQLSSLYRLSNMTTSFKENMFYDCTPIGAIWFDGVDFLSDWGSHSFAGCKNMNNFVFKQSENRLTKIPDNCFYNCSQLRSFRIPDGVAEIEEAAFNSCTSLTNIYIPTSITKVHAKAFSNCPSLNYTEFNDGKYLGNESNKYLVFIGPIDKSIKVLTIVANTKIITDGACSDCQSLTSVSFPASLTHIGESAFKNCTSLSSLSFGSTKDSWKNKVTKGTNWSLNVPATIIRAVDGNTSLN